MNERRNLDLQTYEEYLGFYYAGIIGLIISLIFPVLQIVYALFFFGVHALFLFSSDQPVEDPEHSTVTHYNRYSRWNWFNYSVGAFLSITAFLYLFSPANKSITIFVIWSVAIYFITKYRIRIANLIGKQITNAYLTEQFPDIDDQTISKALEILFNEPNIAVPKLANKLNIDNKEAKELRYLFNVYTKNL